MSYIALYRKFRPQTFEQLKGQDHVVTALKNQLRQRRIGHSYLFTGTRGTGKTSAARILAKAVNCLQPQDGEPCNACENCLAVNAGNFADVIEVDAASNNGVDDIRRLIEEVRYTPIRGTYKVYIIDEAHMITGPAFNAFLKTLEEPPAYAVFILATTEPHKLPVTILSRCQRYDFHRITSEEIADNLALIVQQEGVRAEQNALRYIARMGDGSMRDSISLLDKCIAFHLGNDLTYENVLQTLGTVDTEVFSRLFRSVYQRDVAAALDIIDQAAADGRDLTQFSAEWIRYIRDLLVIRAAGMEMTGTGSPTEGGILGVSGEDLQQMHADAAMAEQTILIRYITELSELLNRLRYSPVKQILLETCVIRLATPQMETDMNSLTDRIRQLEQQMRQGPVSAPPEPFAQSPAAVFDEELYDAGISSGALIPESMMDPDVLSDLMDPSASAAQPEAGSMQPEHAPEQAEMAAPVRKAPAQQDFSQLWEQMTARCSHARIRTAMKKCSAVLDRGQEEMTLRVYVSNVILMNQMQEEATEAMLKELAGELTGMPVQIRVLQGDRPQDGAGGSPRNAGEQFPEELLHNIHFTIGTEEY